MMLLSNIHILGFCCLQNGLERFGGIAGENQTDITELLG